MSITLTVFDETTAGDRGEPIVLEFLTEHITIRELIRQRVYQEVQDYNLNLAKQPVFRGWCNRPTPKGLSTVTSRRPSGRSIGSNDSTVRAGNDHRVAAVF